MIKPILNNIHIAPNWGLFVGQFSDNRQHRHYALQLCVSAGQDFTVVDETENSHTFSGCFINSNVNHRFLSSDPVLILLVNPVSRAGHSLYLNHPEGKIVSLQAPFFHKLQNLYLEYRAKKIPFSVLIQQVTVLFNIITEQPLLSQKVTDERIYRAIGYLEQHFERVIPLDEIASFCHLSPTRFQHLFKEHTGLNYRRYQLWNKLVKSLEFLNEHTITETAHWSGFSDSSHYTRTFKETFGLSPKIITSLK